MNRREFVSSAAALAATSAYPVLAHGQMPERPQGFPASKLKNEQYIENTPIDGYHCASSSAYEAFRDMKFGVRIHWGIYSIWHRGAESWPYLPMSFEDRQAYMSLYKTWNPAGFDAEAWMDVFKDSGMKMFAFTTKHHEGFSMFDTKTRVKSRANWTASGGPRLESCDLAYSIMETPFRRDVVKELCDAAHKRDIKIDLYFSHPDWYDADFRPYVAHPFQIPSSPEWMTPFGLQFAKQRLGDHAAIVRDPTPAEVRRMVERHRAQLLELLTNYGKIDMIGLDMWLGPRVWPELRKTLLMMRERQPNVMLRKRGIGNYGDYYTPERVVPGSEESSDKPWFTIYPLGTDFSYDPVVQPYSSLDPYTALYKVLAHFRYYGIPIESAMPRVTVAVGIRLARVLDLTDGKTGAPPSASPERRMLDVPWRQEAEGGSRGHHTGLGAARAMSSAGKGSWSRRPRGMEG